MDYVAVATIVLYLGGVTAVGAFMVRRSRGPGEWAVAGGGMSGALVALALPGSRIGGGYVGGGVWFLLIKWALWIDLQAPPGSTPLREIWVFLLTRDGVGLDPSYVTLAIPLITVPAVSLLTRSLREGAADAQAEALFRERLKAAEPGERLTSAELLH